MGGVRKAGGETVAGIWGVILGGGGGLCWRKLGPDEDDKGGGCTKQSIRSIIVRLLF